MGRPLARAASHDRVAAHVGATGRGEHQRIELADPAGPQGIAESAIDHSEQLGLRSDRARRHHPEVRVRSLDLRHQGRHLGVSLEGVGQQERYEDDLADTALSELVDHLHSGRRIVLEKAMEMSRSERISKMPARISWLT